MYGTGDVRIRTHVDNSTLLIVLNDFTYAPEIIFILISKRRVCRAEFQVILDDDATNRSREITKIVHKATGRTAILCTENLGGLDEAILSVQMASASVSKDCTLWNRRLCPVSKIKTINASGGLVNGQPDVPLKNDETCTTRCIAKSTRTPVHTLHTTSSKSSVDRVFSDLIGPSSLCSVSGAKYFVTLLDEYGAYSMVRF